MLNPKLLIRGLILNRWVWSILIWFKFIKGRLSIWVRNLLILGWVKMGYPSEMRNHRVAWKVKTEIHWQESEDGKLIVYWIYGNNIYCMNRNFLSHMSFSELPSSELQDEKPGGYHGHKPYLPPVCEMARVNNADNQMVSQSDACDSKKMSLRTQNIWTT